MWDLLTNDTSHILTGYSLDLTSKDIREAKLVAVIASVIAAMNFYTVAHFHEGVADTVRPNLTCIHNTVHLSVDMLYMALSVPKHSERIQFPTHLGDHNKNLSFGVVYRAMVLN